MGDLHGSVAWFEIHVSDVGKAAAFYGAVLGWTFEPLTDANESLQDYLVIRTRSGAPGNGGLARAASTEDVGRESAVVYLFVGDIPRAIEQTRAAGGTVHRPHTNIGGDHGWSAVIRDPDGNYVGLWSDH